MRYLGAECNFDFEGIRDRKERYPVVYVQAVTKKSGHYNHKELLYFIFLNLWLFLSLFRIHFQVTRSCSRAVSMHLWLDIYLIGSLLVNSKLQRKEKMAGKSTDVNKTK